MHERLELAKIAETTQIGTTMVQQLPLPTYRHVYWAYYYTNRERGRRVRHSRQPVGQHLRDKPDLPAPSADTKLTHACIRNPNAASNLVCSPAGLFDPAGAHTYLYHICSAASF